jgi:hypothetical protein
MRILGRNAWLAAVSEAAGRIVGLVEMDLTAEELRLDEVSRLRLAVWFDEIVPGFDVLGGDKVFTTSLADLYAAYVSDSMARSWRGASPG